MYLEIPNGTVVDIQGLRCWIPPEGYIYNVLTQKLEHRGVYSRSDNILEQRWDEKTKIPFPTWYKDTLKKWDLFEKNNKDEDAEFYDEQLEKLKQQEWDRRLNGFWFMNKGNAVYLTGLHYFYLQHWQIDIGSPKFRIIDLEFFYFLKYCDEDPNCMGMLEITKRRNGKTYRAGCYLVEKITRIKNGYAPIQSKTGSDAKKVFAKAVVQPFRKLPRFFRPEYDMSLGVNPKTEMRFQQTNIRGKKAEGAIGKDELGSVIDWLSAEPLAADGSKITVSVQDEFAKTTECNISDRHDVLRYCVVDEEGQIVGKLLYTSTVEKLETDREGVQEGAKKLWDDSDQNKRDENGRTPSGLYRFFMTADRAKNMDIYGYPDVEKTIKQIEADRATVAHNPRALSARIRKEARTIKEAFGIDADKCAFNGINLMKREEELESGSVYKRPFIFYRDAETQLVKRRDIKENEKDFHWRITVLPAEGEENKFIIKDKLKTPARTRVGAITVDSYSNSQGGRKYGSNASAWIGLRYDILNPKNTGKAVGHLIGRPAVKEQLHEQVMLAAEYYGFKVWYEHVADDYVSYFRDRGKIAYLGRYPLSCIPPEKRGKDARHFGIPTTPFSLTTQLDAGISYVEYHSDMIDFEELIANLKVFDPYARTEFDDVVSWLMLLVVLAEQEYVPPPPKAPLVKVYKNENYRGVDPKTKRPMLAG